MPVQRDEANREVFRRFAEAEPVLVDVRLAGEVLPGMQPNMVLTAGAPQPWEDYNGAHRSAVLFGAVHEGLAGSAEEADEGIRSGRIVVGSTHAHAVAGAHTGIHTASTPVFVVEERTSGARGYCSLFEGDSARRLTHGSYGEDVAEKLHFVERVLAPTIGAAIRKTGGIPLVPMVSRALHLGDELHLRTVAATMLFSQALVPAFLDVAEQEPQKVRQTVEFLRNAEHSFVRIALAMGKSVTTAAHGVEGSSVVTAMSMNCNDFSIKVSGLGDQWFTVREHPTFEGKLFADDTRPEDRGWFGTDSIVAEVVGLGGFAGAAAFSLQAWQGGSTERLIERTMSMYAITTGEHPHMKIPYLAYRGVPVGIDIFKVVETGTPPLMNGFITKKKGGGLAGAGVLWAPMEPFRRAVDAYRERYGADA